ncbi:MAG: NADH-quinone oxidoreductase subunit A [Thermodesulfobacteriota bacterium]
MLLEYVPILYLMLVAIGFGVVTVFLSSLIGQRKRTREKAASYECGLPSEGFQYIQTPIKFHVFALLFLIFDLECAFLYPWAVYYDQLGLFGFLEMLIFICILFVCYIYVWKKGALEWE